MFLNFEALYLRTPEDVTRLREALIKICTDIGKKVGVVVNYDSFRIDDDLIDSYADMIKHMRYHHYTGITRYTTSAFMRRKVGEELSGRNMAPHIFESREEAQAFLAGKGGD